MSVSFFNSVSNVQRPKKAETAGSIAFNSKPQLFRPAETAGSIASSTSSNSTSSSCGSSFSACA